MPAITRRSAAPAPPPAEQHLAENAPSRKNQGQKKLKADITTGRAEALVANSTPLNDANPPAQPPAAQKKRGRKAAVAASDDEDNAPNKRAKNTKANATNTMAPLENPHQQAAVRKPTKAQTQAAAKEAKRQASQARLDEAKRSLAQIQVNEDQKRADLREESTRSLPAKRGKRSAKEMEDLFVGDMGGENDSEELVESVADETVNQKVTKKTKGKRQLLRKDIDLLAEGMRGGGSRKKAKVGVNFTGARSSDLSMNPKKYINAGLRTETSEKKKALGGLSDEDIDDSDERPPSPPTKALVHKITYPEKLKRTGSRVNNLVVVESDDDDSEDETSFEITDVVKIPQLGKGRAVTNRAKNSNATTVKKEAAASRKVTVEPAPKLKKASASQSKRGSNSKPKKSTTISQHDEGSGSEMDDKSDATTPFMEDKRWIESFLPTLTHKLFTARQAFIDFRVDSDAFLLTVQDVFDLAYPNIKYTLERTDSLVVKAAQRMNTKKSKIASGVLSEVKDIFKQPEYRKSPVKVAEYCQWAFRIDGPAYCEIPTPINCMFKRSHPQYIKPRGLLRSQIIVSVASQFMRQTSKSVAVPQIDAANPPKALYALILLACERAFKAFSDAAKEGSTDPKVADKKLKKFSNENYWRQLDTFMKKIDEIPSDRWNSILSFLDVQDDPAFGEDSFISACRDDSFVMSSPVKPY